MGSRKKYLSLDIWTQEDDLQVCAFASRQSDCYWKQGYFGACLRRQLLKQRGAIGEPIHRLREASFQLVAMSHVTSKLKAITDKAEEDAAAQASASEGQLEQRIEHVKDPQLRGVLSAFARVLVKMDQLRIRLLQ
jgi:hypothetical protein